MSLKYLMSRFPGTVLEDNLFFLRTFSQHILMHLHNDDACSPQGVLETEEIPQTAVHGVHRVSVLRNVYLGCWKEEGTLRFQGCS